MNDIVTSIHGREIGLDDRQRLVVRNGIAGVAGVIPGLAGDGTTNDATVIQRAVTALGADGGGVLILPGDATYRVTSTITMADNVVIRGGAGTPLYVKQSGTGNTGWAAK